MTKIAYNRLLFTSLGFAMGAAVGFTLHREREPPLDSTGLRQPQSLVNPEGSINVKETNDHESHSSQHNILPVAGTDTENQAFKGLLVDLFFSRLEFLDFGETLSDREILQLYPAFTNFNEEFNRIEASHAKLVEENEAAAVIEIAQFDDQGQVLSSRLKEKILATLGEERGQVMWSKLGDLLEDRYSGFGKHKRVYHISTQTDGSLALKTEKWLNEEGTPPMRVDSLARFEEIPKRYRHLLQEVK